MKTVTIVRALILALIILLLVVTVTWRYGQLKIHVGVTHFFDRAETILSTLAVHDPGLQRSAPPPVPFEHPDDPLPEFAERFSHIPQKELFDPLSSNEKSKRFLQVRYGLAVHSVPVKSRYEIRYGPTWFVWSDGPSQTAPEIVEQASGSIRVYRFLSTPYDASNGLRSRGYLYADLNGIRLGRID